MRSYKILIKTFSKFSAIINNANQFISSMNFYIISSKSNSMIFEIVQLNHSFSITNIQIIKVFLKKKSDLNKKLYIEKSEKIDSL